VCIDPEEELEPDEDMPELIQAHAALAVACLALRMIAAGELGTIGAARALQHLRREHPVARQHLTPEALGEAQEEST